jgi:hypothetical protein
MAVRLVDLEPKWIDRNGRTGLGVIFNCMIGHCCGRIRIYFTNPLDGGPAWPVDDQNSHRWTRTGDSFETLSMTPSVNADVCGHLTLTDGVFN